MSYIHTSTLEISKAIPPFIQDEYFPVANTASEGDVYFKMNPKPDYLDELVDVARQFIELQILLQGQDCTRDLGRYHCPTREQHCEIHRQFLSWNKRRIEC